MTNHMRGEGEKCVSALVADCLKQVHLFRITLIPTTGLTDLL